MSYLIHFFLTIVFLIFSYPVFGNTVWFRQDFEDHNFFSPTIIKDGGNATAGYWEGLLSPHAEIIVLPDARYHQSLRLRRIGSHRSFRFQGKTPFPDGRNYILRFDVCLQGTDKTYCVLRDAAGNRITGLSLAANRSLQTLNRQGIWGTCDVELPSGWSRVEAHFRVNEGDFLPRVIMPDGSVREGKPMVLLQSGAPAVLEFGTILPEGTSAILDNIEITVEAHRSIINRGNVAQTASLAENGFQISDAAAKDHSQNVAILTGNSGVLTFELQTLTSLSTIRISGSEKLAVRAIGINNSGQRQVLAEPEKFTPISGKPGCRQADFQPGIFRTVWLECQGQPGDRIHGIGLFETKAVNQYSIDDKFRTKVYGEFTLPVYSGQQAATLQLFNTTDEPLSVRISLRERYSSRDHGISDHILVAGENAVPFPLANLPEGEFVAEITDHTVRTEERRGAFRRLLRHQRTAEPERPESVEMTGKKIFFPDGHYLHRHHDFSFHTAKADAWQVSHSHQVPGLLMQHGESLFHDNGKLAVTFYSIDNYFRLASKRRFKATALPDNLEQWQIEEIKDDDVSAAGRNELIESVVATDWAPKPGPDGNIHYRIYDPIRDGQVKLTQVLFKYITFMPPGTAGGEALPDWDGLKPGARTTWPIWYKSPGEALVLTQTPLFSDDRSAGEFEAPVDTNDNFVGQWLSDDGKTLFYARGRVLRRYPPHNVPYDNLSNGVRILAVYKTTDGLNYRHSYMALPDENDPVGSQHYGASVIRLRQGNGLYIAFIYRYFAGEQRIFLELAYSWDGFRWNRFPDNPPLLDNGPKGSWNAGYIGVGSNALEIGTRVFYLINWASSAYHICAELIWERDDLSTVNGRMIKNYMEPRGIAAWPLLKQFRDYDELAKYIRDTTINVGLMSWRRDGLFYLAAGNKPGLLETCCIRATGRMTANLVLNPDNGLARFTLLDNDSREIKGYDKTLQGVDDTNTMVFESLPEGEFRVKVELKNGFLYSLGFGR